MPRSVRPLVVLLVALVVPARTHATTADEICSPAANPCLVSSARSITPGSVLDFGTRTLQVKPTGSLIVGGGSMTILAGSVRVEGGGNLTGTVANGVVASVKITTTGDIRVDGGSSVGRIVVAGTDIGGNIELRPGGNADLLGFLDARGDGPGGAGGVITVVAGGNVTLGGTTMLRGGSLGIGGLITVLAGGAVSMPGSVLANADDGGEIDFEALGGDVTLTGNIDVSGGGNYGDGGFLSFIASGSVALRGMVSGGGAGSAIEGGGSGADLSATATSGSITVASSVSINGAPPDGDGGEADFTAGTDYVQSANVFLQDNGADGCGGLFDVFAGRQVNLTAGVQANGGFCGGDTTLEGRAGASIGGELNVDGGEIGGTIDVFAPTLSAGGRLHANGTGATGYGGSIRLGGCDVTVPSSGVVLTNGFAGLNLLAASGQMTIGGQLSSRTTGMNRLEFLNPLKLPKLLSGASVNPAPIIVQNLALPACAPPNGAVCGNGAKEASEECDDGNLVACDGCSPTCDTERCGNGVIECGEECDAGPANGAPGSRCGAGCTVVDVGMQVFVPGSHRGPAACLAEWAVRNPEQPTTSGFPAETQSCIDGDPRCDTDGATDGGCTFAVNVCLAMDDPRVPSCQPQAIDFVKMRRPSPLGGGDAIDLANGVQIADALQALGTDVYYRDTLLHEGTPQAARDNCTTPLALRVPHAPGAIGRRIFTLAAGDTDARRMRRNRMTLACEPNPAVCGNGAVEIGEECDDGGTADCDGCSATCRVERCGDGVVQCNEDCDEGPANGTPGGHCSATCSEIPAPLRIPGGTSNLDCGSEYAIALGDPVILRNGLPSTRQTCVDGDPTCDFDPTPGTCRLHLWTCVGGADDRIACSAEGVSALGLDRPSPTATGAAAAARTALLAAFDRVPLPLAAGETCTRRVDVDLPAGRSRLVLRTSATSATGAVDRDGLKLGCAPAGSRVASR